MSTRLYGSLGCVYTGSSSSSHSSIAAQSNRTRSLSSSSGESGYRLAALSAVAPSTRTSKKRAVPRPGECSTFSMGLRSAATSASGM